MYKEIRMSNALMIIYRIPKSPIAFIFAATRASRTLRDGLKLFAEQFCNEFQEYFIDPTHTDRFSKAELIIEKCFPHIPIYD